MRPQMVRVVAVSTMLMQSVGQASQHEAQPTQSSAAAWPNAGPTYLPEPRPLTASAS